MKKRLISIGLVLVLALSLGAGAVLAATSQPASKATAKVADITLIDSTTAQDWTTILEQDIKTPAGKDLFIDVSLQCGLYTQTQVKSKGGNKDTSTADAMISVQVLVDGTPVEPGEVVFSRRYQELSAVLQGQIPLVWDETLGRYVISEGELTPEEIELILDTMDAHAFNFVAVDLTSGVHTVEVQAMIETDSSLQGGTTSATATIGKGSVTIELIRMIKGEDIELTEQ
ncbi:hypothetical protein ACFLW4_05510 [Chloroflexota bacterium]